MKIRAVSALFVAAIAALALAGCSIAAPTTTPTPKATTASSAPTVGECWTGTLAEGGAWSNWLGAEAGSCSTSHQYYTYDVPTMTGSLPKAELSSGTTVAPAIVTAASDACAPSTHSSVQLSWNEQLVRTFFFIPSAAQWAAGARWVRCDLGILSTGTTVAKEKLSNLPASATLEKSLGEDPDKYDYCLNTGASLTIPPFTDSNAVITECSNNPQWSLSSQHGVLPGGANAAYPSSSTMSTLTSQFCTAFLPQGDTYLPEYPNASEWAAGERDVSCWDAVGTAGGGGIV